MDKKQEPNKPKSLIGKCARYKFDIKNDQIEYYIVDHVGEEIAIIQQFTFVNNRTIQLKIWQPIESFIIR